MPVLYSDRQIGLIRNSGQIIARVFDLLRTEIKPGVTSLQLNDKVHELIKSEGAIPAFLGYSYGEQSPFPAAICASVNDVIIHGIPDETPLVEGDIISIDIGVQKDNYFADAAWTFPVGSVDDIGKKLLEVGEHALAAGIAAAQPKHRLFEVSAAIEQVAKEGNASVVREFVGHGVGLSLHEEPQIRNYIDPNEKDGFGKTFLRPGMVLAIEPMLNEKAAMIKMASKVWPVKTKDGGRSVHFEHTIVITANGPEILTK